MPIMFIVIANGEKTIKIYEKYPTSLVPVTEIKEQFSKIGRNEKLMFWSEQGIFSNTQDAHASYVKYIKPAP